MVEATETETTSTKPPVATWARYDRDRLIKLVEKISAAPGTRFTISHFNEQNYAVARYWGERSVRISFEEESGHVYVTRSNSNPEALAQRMSWLEDGGLRVWIHLLEINLDDLLTVLL